MSSVANENFPPGHPRHVPEAWPLLLSRDQLCAYLGCSASTLATICPVHPRDMGANLVRYYRPDIDAWAARLPPRLGALHKRQEGGEDAAPAPEDDSIAADVSEDRRTSAIERARARASGGGKCRKAA